MRFANLAEYKDQSGLTSREIAQKLRISEAYLSQILSGKRSLSKKLAVRISEKTGIPVLNLLYPEAQKEAQA